MSASESHGTAHGHDDPHHISARTYLVGFASSVVLTAIPFWLVMSGVLANALVTGLVVVAFAVVQIFVHTVAFLHLNRRAEGGWNLLAYLFTGVLVVITIGGSLWIMYHLNGNLMPMAADMRALP